MAAQAGSARTEGGPAGPAEPAEQTPSSFEYRSRLKVFGLPFVYVVRGIDSSSGRRPPAVGIIAGRTVTSHESERPYPVAISITPGGLAVMYVRNK